MFWELMVNSLSIYNNLLMLVQGHVFTLCLSIRLSSMKRDNRVSIEVSKELHLHVKETKNTTIMCHAKLDCSCHLVNVHSWGCVTSSRPRCAYTLAYTQLTSCQTQWAHGITLAKWNEALSDGSHLSSPSQEVLPLEQQYQLATQSVNSETGYHTTNQSL